MPFKSFSRCNGADPTQELGNYAEHSGAPSTAETYTFAKTLLNCATASPDGRQRALLVGGGIANFTSVAGTFTGIVKAMREAEEDIRAAKLKIFVRRGGPQVSQEALSSTWAPVWAPVPAGCAVCCCAPDDVAERNKTS